MIKVKRRKAFLIFVITLAVITFSQIANAATFVVNTTVDTQDASAGNGVCADGAGACSLRAAITEANALAGADVITLPAGTYTETLVAANDNVNGGGDFDITSDITINGAGAGSTFVEANVAPGVATERVFHIRGATAATTLVVMIDGVTIRNGRYANNTFGGGIRIDQGTGHTITISNSTITANQNGSSGGGIAVSGPTGATNVNINNSIISNNSAGSAAAGTSAIGGGIMGNSAASTININDSTISGNTASTGLTGIGSSGGGVSSVGTLNITDSTITGNTASVTVAGSTGNAFSGGVHVTGGTTTITGSTISGNNSTASGGTGNGFAGGIYNQQATVSVIDSTVSNNTASSFHGGIRTLAQTVLTTTNITNSTVSGNTSVGEGGGVINFSVGAVNSIVNVTGSTISGNMATSGTSVGGGVENVSTSTGLATINLTNSTVSGNSSNDGAGIWNSGTTASINLNFSTVASNTATTNGGGLNQQATGTTNLKNSIVGDNTAATGPDIFGTITSQDYNHVENTSGGTFFVNTGKNQGKMIDTSFFALPNDVTGTDPQLAALANNGGSTLTHLPAVASPVMNTIPNGTNDCGTIITTSQNALTRPQETGCEKGAAERQAPTAANIFISGKVLTAKGSGVNNVVVRIFGGSLTQPRIVRTSALGNFRFDDLQAGETYILEVSSRKLIFDNPTQVVFASEDLTGINFWVTGEY